MKKIVMVLLLCLSLLSYADNASVVIHQSTLNLFLTAIGTVTGTNDFNAMGIKGKYTWKIENPRIEIEKDKARFIGDATINAAGNSYNSTAEGAVEVKYDKETNKIFVKISEAKIDITAKAFGKKVKITDIDVAQYYRPEFQFAGPQPMQSFIEIKMPDGNIKKVNIKAEPAMRLEKEQIVVGSALTFTAAN